MPSSPPSRSILLISCILFLGITAAYGLAAASPRHVTTTNNNNGSRRTFLSSSAAAFFLALPQIADARYVLNEDTGEYDEVQDEDWQTAWGKRLDKAKSMSTEDVFLAAQGAGNLELKEGEESEASKKRRALAGCRNDGMRKKGGARDAKECTSRVLGGDYQFMVDVM
mmetsp:Transcript_5485/g.11947  ORF Transcript_5485/g.11947 Transcript_5485/m.11947 type:complete len:168 (-) Transcript_5485:164-667(-)|eukprot:CAMPEP_0172553720 /NCGR_PEP_ID=MMETSP1067-20121228/51450_1 /TAXON_ID=265564 ORGANISM="Thalassiosira punctigera, Strain Tpunct2005C2" /NCGR_SAMPLE_ID=MMETSP1067 /ASSEMBLY_ACC=CAM_ASM_000444 /LENGTH=167 /DNA_ID=CAMNT_0013341945 /DNA_START=132 /DNA_END=635 /DNA_ORIENTATION=-